MSWQRKRGGMRALSGRKWRFMVTDTITCGSNVEGEISVCCVMSGDYIVVKMAGGMEGDVLNIIILVDRCEGGRKEGGGRNGTIDEEWLCLVSCHSPSGRTWHGEKLQQEAWEGVWARRAPLPNTMPYVCLISLLYAHC